MESQQSVPDYGKRSPIEMFRRQIRGCLAILAGTTLLIASCTLIRGEIPLWAIPAVHGVISDASTGIPIADAFVSVSNDTDPRIVATARSTPNGHYTTKPALTYEWFTLPGDRVEHCTVSVSADGYVTTKTSAVHDTGELWAGQPAADRYIDFILRPDAVGDTKHYNEWDVEREQAGEQ
ncbi:carboxypeptidase-like regulatory domain-containing protein [Rhodopirellula bahusiensis]|nr:carboxypeptidase-like regulatory domain-containing protein [Rhodopirellula bahusiensis]